MPKLWKIHTLRNLMRPILRQHYCIYRHIYKVNAAYISKSVTFYSHQSHYSILSSPEDATDIEIRQLSSEFPDPKKIFSQVLNEAYLTNQDIDLKPSISYEQLTYGDKNKFLWKATLQMKWPEHFEAEGVSSKKTDAEKVAFLYACRKLKKFGILDQDNKPALPKEEHSIKDHSVKVAKGDLFNIYQRIWTRYGKKEYIPRFNSQPSEGIYGGSKYWKSELHLMYPEDKTFEAKATRLRDAENIAAAKALFWLISQGVISKNRKLIQYSKEDETKLKELHQAPYSICIPALLQVRMQEVLSDLRKQKLLLSNSSSNTESINEIDPKIIRNIMSENEYFEPTEDELLQRSLELYESKKFMHNKCDTEFLEMQNFKSSLPILHKREEILKLIDENQVAVLSGETGCGKSTQVPQFILDHFISQKKGAECNIVVAQPRRISTLSIADRVAKERGEKVGKTVGYHIRLNRYLPPDNGAILICTTGMLLRKMCTNPDLAGVSHVIVDEVHERSIHTDFLLILLKRLLEHNRNLKLLLMSASFNTQLFSQYFNNCPVINVPGKMYPVREYFLEDLMKIIPDIKPTELSRPTLHTDLLLDVIDYIDKNQRPGAILCFLPGWQDIRTMHLKLLENEKIASRFFICPIHSRLPPEEQKKIFINPPYGKRKVILATNIAETSITVNDVVYVVDSGLHKGTFLDAEAGISTLTVQWITKANVRQRRGRAGRVQPGVCYHLFSRKTLMGMDEYPVPEIVRIPLEKVILDCKLYCPDMKSEDFLSLSLQPPSESSIQSGVNDLQIMGILDEIENLTDLGKVVVRFGTHPRLSIALIYASFLGCLDPVLTICSILTLEKEPFLNTLDDKSQMKKVKQLHDNSLFSDHLSLNKIFQTWTSLNEETDISDYCKEYQLDHQSLQQIKQLKELFAEDLLAVGILDGINSHLDLGHDFNQYSSHALSILAALAAAFFPNMIKIVQGEISHGKLSKDNITYHLIKGQKAYIQKESILSETEELPSPWLVFFSAMKSEARRLTMVSALSSVPGICLLLLAGRDIAMKSVEDEKQGNSILLIDDYKRLNFSCSEKEARLLLDWRECMQDIFKLYILNLKQWNSEEHEYMLYCKKQFLQIMKEILETPQVPFTKGQVYRFEDNHLVAKDL